VLRPAATPGDRPGRGFDLVLRGTLTVVMGLSGSGKCTLLQCAAGLDRPTSGTVRLGGMDLSRLSRRRLSVLRRRRVGFVFQALNLVPTLTVAENIAFPPRNDSV
jgi:ABC-type lipoprotein export system ATPase subunit